MKYYGNGKQMEYDFIVSTGADPNQIMVQYDGAKSISVNDAGQLVVETEWGNVTELRPLIYQFDVNGCMPIDGQYVLFTDNTFGFDLGDRYDPTLALVINPVLSYSTYLGGDDIDKGKDIELDDSGAMYVTGYTESSDFPTVNEYESDDTDDDIFVTKFSSDGSSLVYSTYIGGNDDEEGYCIAIDTSGAAYVTGWTESTNYPTVNQYQTDQWICDAFVTKLSADGDALVYSTYLGGTSPGWDIGYGIAVDKNCSAYIVGWSDSDSFPITYNAYQTYQYANDGFVTKLAVAGNSLVYSTYLGGNGRYDLCSAIAVDDSLYAYVTGRTTSTNFPATYGAFQTSSGGVDEAFITKFSIGGGSLVYSTYLGGGAYDFGWDIAVDEFGVAYVTGRTNSTDFPTKNPYQDTLTNNNRDAFVTKLSDAGDTLIYSTFLGGYADDIAMGIGIDASGCAYIAGETGSSDFPTENEYQSNQTGVDAFVTRLSASGNSLKYSTYLGGSSGDYGYGIAVNGSGTAYVTGYTSSTNFPTENEYQTHQGERDVFVTKLDLCVPGDADASGYIDIDDVVYLNHYIFGGGPEPAVALCCGDADGSSNVDIDDVTYLVAYIFGGGPAPDPDACTPPW